MNGCVFVRTFPDDPVLPPLPLLPFLPLLPPFPPEPPCKSVEPTFGMNERNDESHSNVYEIDIHVTAARPQLR